MGSKDRWWRERILARRSSHRDQVGSRIVTPHTLNRDPRSGEEPAPTPGVDRFSAARLDGEGGNRHQRERSRGLQLDGLDGINLESGEQVLAVGDFDGPTSRRVRFSERLVGESGEERL